MRGWECLEASNGSEALALNHRQPCELILTDILMPEKEGLETIREMRRDFPGLKIIAMTGGGQGGGLNFLDAAKRLGADATLEKPFDLASLFDLVESLIGRRVANDNARSQFTARGEPRQ